MGSMPLFLVLSLLGGSAVVESAPPLPAAHIPVAEIARASQEDLTFFQVLDELLFDFALDLGKLSPVDISPLALRSIHLSSNLSTELEETLAIRINAVVNTVPNIAQVQCLSCFAVRSRLEGGEWVVKRGAVSRADLNAVGEELGAASFMDLVL